MVGTNLYDGPLFLTGVYRSGTTLVAQILNSHSKLRVIYDNLHFFRFYLGRHLPVQERYGEIVAAAASRLGQRWGITVPVDRVSRRLKRLPTVELADVYSAIMVETFCDGSDDLRWGEKSLLQWTNIPLFLQMFPHGQVIHIMRDPRDALASWREYTHEPAYRYLDGVFCCLHSMHWAATIGATLPKGQYLVLRHEDVVNAPESTVGGLCDFLGVPYEQAMLDLTRSVDQAGDRWDGDSSFGDVGPSIAPVTVGRWRHKLEPFEMLFVESVLGDLLPRFGYQPSGVQTSASDLRLLWDCFRSTPLLQSRLSRWLETGEGVDRYPSDPTDPANWETSDTAPESSTTG